MGKRKAMTISIVNIAASVKLSEDQKKIESVRVAAGACAPTIKRLRTFEHALEGCDATETVVKGYAGMTLNDVEPITDMRATEWYRKEIVQVLAVRAVCDAIRAAEREV